MPRGLAVALRRVNIRERRTGDVPCREAALESIMEVFASFFKKKRFLLVLF
jgi:hypothetical protein